MPNIEPTIGELKTMHTTKAPTPINVGTNILGAYPFSNTWNRGKVGGMPGSRDAERAILHFEQFVELFLCANITCAYGRRKFGHLLAYCHVAYQ